MTVPTRATFGPFTVDVPWTLPTANHRMHWRKRAELTAQARDAVYLQALGYLKAAGLSPNKTEPRTLQLVLLRGPFQRRLDRTNLYAALKPVEDGLVRAGWLANDNEKMLPYYEASQRIDRERGPACIITVGVPLLEEAV